jgi:cytochrome c556
MKIRKLPILAVTAFATGLGYTGYSLAMTGDDETPLHKAMEAVQAKNAFIVKNLKTPVLFKKNQKEIAENAKALTTLGKSVRDDTEAAKKEKKTQKEWTDLMDSYIKESESFATAVAASDAAQPAAKDKFKSVTATCAACHAVFRKED